MKQILYTISLLLLLGACTDETYTDALSANGGKPGKPVPVNLSLNIQPLQSPLAAGTKAGGETVSSTEVCKGMEISLVKTPVAPETRAADMVEVKNFWVLQFNGTDPATSTLTQKHFYPGNSVKDVILQTSTEKNRIIVIANAEETTFENLPTNGTYTLSSFNDQGISFSQPNFPLFTPSGGGSPRPVLCGGTDIIVTDNAQADIMLYHSTAEVRATVALSSKLKGKYTKWTYQFMSVPKTSFYHSIGRVPAFPGATAQYGNYGVAEIKNTSYISISANLPVNLHHLVPFTTPEKRVTNAPFNSTYLQIMGANVDGNGMITESVVYQIHLGSNFTDDYSVTANYSYQYSISISGENDDDSRVIKFIPGYFSGILKMYDSSGSLTPNASKAVTWRYDKRIEVYIQDVGGNGVWLASSASMPAANSFIDGRKNTLDLMGVKANYPAIQKCIDLNGAGVTADNLVWYTPSFGQSLGIYVAGSSTLKTLSNATYWSSSTDGTDAWATKIWTGQSSSNSPDGLYYLRCVKDIIPGNTVQ